MVATYVFIVGLLFIYIALEALYSLIQGWYWRRKLKQRGDQYLRYVREYEAYSTAPDGSCAWCGHPEANNHVCEERV